MSRTTIYVARENGDMEAFRDFGNAWLSGMMVWREMGRKYCGVTEPGAILLDEKVRRRVWDLAGDPAVAEYDRITMQTTFDRALVPREEFLRVAEAMEKTAAWLPAHATIRDQAAALRELASDRTARAAGWQQTSVAESQWYAYPQNDEEDGRPYNIDRDEGHWWLPHLGNGDGDDDDDFGKLIPVEEGV